MSVLQEISPHVKNMKQLEYVVLARRVSQIEEELRQVKTLTLNSQYMDTRVNFPICVVIRGTSAVNSPVNRE